MIDKTVTFNADKKFDIQLSAALVKERRLADVFEHMRIAKIPEPKIELKSEEWLWERTGNICIEYRWNDEPSGIAAIEADYWVHELHRDGETLCYLMFPAERLKELARKAYEAGRHVERCGDNGRSCVVLIPIEWLRHWP